MVTAKAMKKVLSLCAAACTILALLGSSALAAEDPSADIMHGPDVPPAGMRYDEWKGIEYTTDTEFALRTFWSICMYDESNAESHGLFRDPEHVEDAVLQIVDARAEPVGKKVAESSFQPAGVKPLGTPSSRMPNGPSA